MQGFSSFLSAELCVWGRLLRVWGLRFWVKGSYFGVYLVVKRNTHATQLMRSFTLSQNVFGVNDFGVKLSHDDLH